MAGHQSCASYWDIKTTAAVVIADIARKLPEYGREDVVWHAWHAICRLYFPGRRTNPTAPLYSVERDAYRGTLPPDHDEHKQKNVIMVRLIETLPFKQRGTLPPVAIERDCLWVKCKVPDQDGPRGWNSAMVEAVTRLAAERPDQSLFLILACGLEWMIFKWDPARTQASTTLHFLKQDGRDTWPVDKRVSVPQFSGQQLIPGHPILRYVQPQQNGDMFIDTTLADSLDYWSLDDNGKAIHLSSMMFLENCFGLIQGSLFPGQNPPLPF